MLITRSSKMSTSTGIEIVIASENRSTLEKQLKSIDDFLLDLSSFIYRNGKKQFGDSKTFQLREQIDRIRKVGDSYIFQEQPFLLLYSGGGGTVSS